MVKSERDVSKFYKSAKNVEDAQDGMRLWGDPGTTWQTQGTRRKRNDQTLQNVKLKIKRTLLKHWTPAVKLPSQGAG